MLYDEEKLVAHFADAPDDICLNDIDLTRVPRHISCIMDVTEGGQPLAGLLAPGT